MDVQQKIQVLKSIDILSFLHEATHNLGPAHGYAVEGQTDKVSEHHYGATWLVPFCHPLGAESEGSLERDALRE